MDLAAAAYQRVMKNNSDALTANSAKFAMAQIDERQNKLTEALNLYEEIARSDPNDSLGSEAGMRIMELKTKQPAPLLTAPVAPAKPGR